MNGWEWVCVFILGFLLFFLGAVKHEADLKRNFDKYGNAHAWFYEIKQAPR